MGSTSEDDDSSRNKSSHKNNGRQHSEIGGDGLSEEEVNRALASYEKDFADMGLAGPAAGKQAASTDSRTTPHAPESGADASFDDQLQGILGNKAKKAVLVTNVKDPHLLAAFCVMAEVSASCVGASSGAVALLDDLDGQAPEEAARRLTTLVSSLPLVLIVNRADRLEAHSWINGRQGEKIAPPLLLMRLDNVIEDLVISQASPATLAEDGRTVVSTGTMDKDDAWHVIRHYTRRR